MSTSSRTTNPCTTVPGGWEQITLRTYAGSYETCQTTDAASEAIGFTVFAQPGGPYIEVGETRLTPDEAAALAARLFEAVAIARGEQS